MSYENLLPTSQADAEVVLNTAAALAKRGHEVTVSVPAPPNLSPSFERHVLRYYGIDAPVPKKTGIFTEYTASVSQTDSTPTITASNQKIREGIVANNCLPFGTKIEVNNNIYVIQDRMNERYGCENFDIYVRKYSQAKRFGKRTLRYKII